MRMIVTGAASGIGRAVAVLAAEAAGGAAPELLLVDRDGAGLEESARQAVRTGARVVTMAADLTDVDAAAAIVARARDAFGGLDALVSNAGILHSASLLDLDVETYERMFAVNTRPTWLLGKAAHALLSASKGSIVATASIAAEHPTPPLGTYSASKAALVMLVRQMALEWGRDGIRCNCVSPGPTMTAMSQRAFGDLTDPVQRENRRLRESKIPLGKVGQPEDVARTILFLLGPAAAHITGVNLPVDGGLSQALAPATGGGSNLAEPR